MSVVPCTNATQTQSKSKVLKMRIEVEKRRTDKIDDILPMDLMNDAIVDYIRYSHNASFAFVFSCSLLA